MTKQVINLGTAPSGAGGDTYRSALVKSMANFDELYAKFVNYGFDTPLTLVSANLNSVETFGFYYISVGVSTPAGEPYGYLLVNTISSTYVSQQFTSTQNGHVWTRSKLNGTWTTWGRVYNTVNILGTVGQSGGIPTGSILERGTNANGYYVRFADGTQICTTIAAAIVPPTGISNVWWTFPIAFSSVNYINMTPNIGVGSDARNYVTAGTYNTLSTTQANFSSYMAASVGCYAVAIGRWF